MHIAVMQSKMHGMSFSSMPKLTSVFGMTSGWFDARQLIGGSLGHVAAFTEHVTLMMCLLFTAKRVARRFSSVIHHTAK